MINNAKMVALTSWRALQKLEEVDGWMGEAVLTLVPLLNGLVFLLESFY